MEIEKTFLDKFPEDPNLKWAQQSLLESVAFRKHKILVCKMNQYRHRLKDNNYLDVLHAYNSNKSKDPKVLCPQVHEKIKKLVGNMCTHV